MRGFVIFSLLLLVAAGCTTTAESAPDDAAAREQAAKTVCQPVADEFALIDDVLDGINAARILRGLAPLRLDPLLSAVADEFACEMIREGFLAHANPRRGLTPGERLTSAGYIYYAMGENVAAGQSSAEEVVADWLASDAHRANLLSEDWRETGIAVRRGGEYGWYWVQEFADPLDIALR